MIFTKEVEKQRQELMKKKQEFLARDGYYTDYVEEAFYDIRFVDCHTHGLKELKLKEFQFVIPLPPDESKNVFTKLIMASKIGVPLTEGLYPTVYKVPIMLKAIGDKWRIIFPDSSGRFPEDKDCDPFYAAQILEEPTF